MRFVMCVDVWCTKITFNEYMQSIWRDSGGQAVSFFHFPFECKCALACVKLKQCSEVREVCACDRVCALEGNLRVNTVHQEDRWVMSSISWLWSSNFCFNLIQWARWLRSHYYLQKWSDRQLNRENVFNGAFSHVSYLTSLLEHMGVKCFAHGISGTFMTYTRASEGFAC